MGVPLSDKDWSPDDAPGNATTLYIRFTDSSNPIYHPSVPYTSGKSLAELTDEEIAGYWEEVVAAHPELQ